MSGNFLPYVSGDASVGKATDERMTERMKRECAEAPPLALGFIGPQCMRSQPYSLGVANALESP